MRPGQPVFDIIQLYVRPFADWALVTTSSGLGSAKLKVTAWELPENRSIEGRKWLPVSLSVMMLANVTDSGTESLLSCWHVLVCLPDLQSCQMLVSTDHPNHQLL